MTLIIRDFCQQAERESTSNSLNYCAFLEDSRNRLLMEESELAHFKVFATQQPNRQPNRFY